ncbi:MAG: DnaB-like helicase C-terminal domain-containing protein [Actinomycetota bacterium]
MDDYQATIETLLERSLPFRRAEIPKIREEFPNIKLSQIKRDLKIDEADIKTITDVVDSYELFTEDLTKFRITLGYKEIDQTIRGIAPGEILGFVARTAVGKTLFALNCIRNVTENHKVPIMFFSLEQESPQVFERLAAITCNRKPVSIEKCSRN